MSSRFEVIRNSGFFDIDRRAAKELAQRRRSERKAEKQRRWIERRGLRGIAPAETSLETSQTPLLGVSQPIVDHEVLVAPSTTSEANNGAIQIPENALDLLHEIIEDQQALAASGALDKLGPSSRIAFLRAFKGSAFFMPAYRNLIRLGLRYPDQGKFKTKSRGRLFELMTYAYLAAHQERGVVLTSPADTRAFFTLLHGGPTFIDDEGLPAIDRKWIPDGMQIRVDGENPRIERILDYKLHTGPLNGQVTGFEHLSRELSPLITEDVSLDFVFPSQRRNYPGVNGAGNVAIRTIPITDGMFSGFYNHIVGEYRSTNESGTILEMRAESASRNPLFSPKNYDEPSQSFFRVGT